MSWDFAAVLLALTVLSGAVWAFDARVLRPRRGAAGTAAEPLLVEYARSFFPVFLVVLLLRSFLCEPFRIPSASMMPTLLIGDFVLVNKYVYGIRLPVINLKILVNRDPRRGEVIVFRYPEDPSVAFIKRVVGVPGDHVEYRGKVLYVNGVEVAQEQSGGYHASGAGLPMDGDELREERLGDVTHDLLLDPNRPAMDLDITVPPGRYFVLGDNRDNSRDSRYWGFVPDRNLVGRAFMIWMNWDCGWDWSEWRCENGGIHWNRLGKIIH